MSVIMKCGCVGNSSWKKQNGEDLPYCIIHNCVEVSNEQPNLIGRKSKCRECGNTTNSSLNLPFFHYNKDKNYDYYYCGCYGWE